MASYAGCTDLRNAAHAAREVSPGVADSIAVNREPRRSRKTPRNAKPVSIGLWFFRGWSNRRRPHSSSGAR